MLENVRRNSNRITFVLLVLCGAILLNLAFRSAQPHKRLRRRGTLVITGNAAESYQNGLRDLQGHNDALAEQEFRHSLDADPQNPQTWMALAGLLKKQGIFPEALSYYRMALNAHEKGDSVRVSYWRMSGQIDPEEALGYAELCASLKLKQETDVAYSDVVAAVERKHLPTFPGAAWKAASTPEKRGYLALALWRENQGRHAEALAAYAKAGIHQVR